MIVVIVGFHCGQCGVISCEPVWKGERHGMANGARPAAAAKSSAGASGGGTGDWPPIEKLPPLGDCLGRPITCPSYAYPVGTVVFDAKNHEAN